MSPALPPGAQHTDGLEMHEGFLEGACSWILRNLEHLRFLLSLPTSLDSWAQHTSLSHHVLCSQSLEEGGRGGWGGALSPLPPVVVSPQTSFWTLTCRGGWRGCSLWGQRKGEDGPAPVKLLLDVSRAGAEAGNLLNCSPVRGPAMDQSIH